MKFDDQTAQAIKAARARKKAYRTSLGFSTQEDTKDYFKAKDVYSVNWPLIENYNGELAVVNITSLFDNLPEDEWKENPRFETVFTTKIPESCFKWYITTGLPSSPETLYSTLA